jgi:NAD(P)-dependent dehydrogenase (short-subunit alcohol dehydrogenase family)
VLIFEYFIDPSSVHNFVQKLTSAENADLTKIDGLVLNAATKCPTYKVNADGVELNLATNHMGHFLLVGLLLQKMFEQNVPAKILFISTDISAKDE